MDGLLINGQLHYVSDTEDFIDLIEKYMGNDSAKYLIDKIMGNENEVKRLKSKIEKIERKLDYDNKEIWEILQEE